jgi:peptidyl-prolyl cis-trans isomerase C
MKRTLLAVLTLTSAIAAFAQEKPADPSQRIVAVVNSETITKAKLDALYNRLPAQMRAQYDKTGGKMAFLDNYVAKRLLVQEAMKTNLEERPHVKAALEAARESALFDQYVRDVIAADIVTDAAMKAYYQANASRFATPEAVKARHIVVLFQGKTKEQAQAKINAALNEIRGNLRGKTPDAAVNVFRQVAEKYSEDSTREQGGELGWFNKGVMDANFEAVAFQLQPGLVSGVVETAFGYHVILAEGRRPPGTTPFDQVRNDIREILLSEKMGEVMTAVQKTTAELRRASKVAIFRENID